LDDLHAEQIDLPEFSLDYLRRGHAIHFRCTHPEAMGLRVDVMTWMRGVDPFPKLWKRRTSFTLPDGSSVEALSLPDLVQAKKTQRDKDWPMLRRVMEAHYFANRHNPTGENIDFWLGELRTASLLIEVAAAFPPVTRRLLRKRPLLVHALAGDTLSLENELDDEERREREEDRKYWQPLKAELEILRRARRGPRLGS
jgi:hypothetical protein